MQHLCKDKILSESLKQIKKNLTRHNKSQIPTAKQYFNTTEILNRQALPLQDHFKKKIQEYFKKTND